MLDETDSKNGKKDVENDWPNKKKMLNEIRDTEKHQILKTLRAKSNAKGSLPFT